MADLRIVIARAIDDALSGLLPEDLATASDAVLTALREAGALVEWRPIEEAPKDGTYVLLYSAMIESSITGLWVSKELLPKTVREIWPDLEGKWCEGLYISYDELHNPYRPIHDVTHWQPLPPAPGAAK